MNTATAIHTRWGLRRDIPEAVAIERASFSDPWCEEAFLARLRQRNCIMVSAELGLSVVGYMLYELHRSRLHLLNLAVHPAYRRVGIGRLLAAKLVYKCDSHRRRFVTLDVAETNLSAQLFFRSVGFEAAAVNGDAYRLVYAAEGGAA